ncbi:MAG: hypothetical protein IJD77_00945 [Clostridia bacterium]|nr:hypothetical protein [Clostridia bacterium]
MDEQNEMLDYEEVESEETNQDELEFSETGEKETEAAETSLEEDSNTEEESKSGQDAFQAQKRRIREEKEEALRKKIEENAYRKGIIEALGGTNPYTGENIVDDVDIEEYLAMRKLDQEGKDPVTDYRRTLKEKKRAEDKAKQDHDKTVNEIAEFAKAFPNVDLDALFKDERFLRFAGKRVEREGLSDVYADYVSFTSDINTAAEKKAEMKEKNKAARAKASPGSLTGGGSEIPHKSVDQMSDAEFEKMLAKAKSGALKKS